MCVGVANLRFLQPFWIFFSNLDGTYNPEIEICWADQVHDKKSICCGNKVYNKDGKTSGYWWLYFLVCIIYILNIYLLYVSILTGHILSINQDMITDQVHDI